MAKKKEWRPLPDFLTVKESKIEGLGIFATKEIKEGSDLGISHVYDDRFPDGYIRLPIGAFINHHEMPNCKGIVSESDPLLGKLKHIRIIAIKDIEEGFQKLISDDKMGSIFKCLVVSDTNIHE